MQLPLKTALECEDHYWTEYASRFGVKEPRRLCVSGEWVNNGAYEPLPEEVEEPVAAIEVKEEEVKEEEVKDEVFEGVPKAKPVPCDTSFRNPPPAASEAPAVGSVFRRTKFVATLSDAQLATSRGELAGAELSGYMPLRGDFDVEHDNDAELLIADMEFRDDESNADRELKRKVLEMYNAKLDDRESRKRFVIERGLLDSKRQRAIEARLAPDERALVAQMYTFTVVSWV